MAIRRALSAGTWNPEAGTGTATWDAVPVDGDTVHANGFAITMSAGCIMANTHLRTTAGTATLGGAISAGGSFTVNASTDINFASVLSGSSICLAISGASITSNVTIGDCRGSGTTANIVGLSLTATLSTIYFVNCLFSGGASTGTPYGLATSGSGSITFSGCTCNGGIGSTTGYGVNNTGAYAGGISGTLNLVQAASVLAPAFVNQSTSNVVLSGTVNHQSASTTLSNTSSGNFTYTATSETITGIPTVATTGLLVNTGTGVLTFNRPAGSLETHAQGTPYYAFKNSVSGQVVINGDLTAGVGNTLFHDNAAGAGFLRHNGVITGASAYVNALTVNHASGGKIYLDRIARNPVSGFLPNIIGSVVWKTGSTIVATTESGTVTLVDATTAGDPPSQANVRSGTTYQFGAMTGTCSVPGASSVAAGVAVDATTGTAVLTQAAVSSVLSTYETNGVASQNDLASVSVDLSGVIGYLTAITAAIGAFTGSGVNTVKGFLTALMSKTASTPSDIGGTFSPSTDSIESISEATSAVKSKTDSLTFTTPGKVDATAVLDSATQDQLDAIQAQQTAINAAISTHVIQAY